MPPGVPTARGSPTSRVRPAVSSCARGQRGEPAGSFRQPPTVVMSPGSPLPQRGEPVASSRTWTKTSGPPDSATMNPKPSSPSYQDWVASGPVGTPEPAGRPGPREGEHMLSLGCLFPCLDDEETPSCCPSDTTPWPTMARGVHEDLITTAVWLDVAGTLGGPEPGDGAQQAERSIGGRTRSDLDVARWGTPVPLALISNFDHRPLGEPPQLRRWLTIWNACTYRSAASC